MTSSNEAELLARLQAQFGDMNVNEFLNGCPENDNNNSAADDDDSESSLEEPSPEELAAWQEAQFAKGKVRLQTQELLKEAATVGRRRRRGGNKSLLDRHEGDDKDWERVPTTPDLNESSIFFPNNADGMELAGVHPLLQKLTAFDPDVLGTKWHRLFSSSGGDGVSLTNLLDKLRGYDGATIIIFGGQPSTRRCLGNVNCLKPVSIGFFTFDMWIESEDMFGSDDDCFLFTLDQAANDVKIYPSRNRENSSRKGMNRYVYCNRNDKSEVSGLGIGGTSARPRLHITESLEDCRAFAYDELFEAGGLLPFNDSLYYFDVNEIEVWAVGGISEQGLAAQAKQKEIEMATLEQARRVDKRLLLEHIENGFAWKSGDQPGLFGHRDHTEMR